MNWEMISAIGQMLGAIGVIVSLIYLALQIRNHKTESRRASINLLTTHWSDLMKAHVESEEFCTLWLRGVQSFESLEGPAKLRFSAHLGRFLRTADSLYLYLRRGEMDDQLWRGVDRTLAGTAAYPGFQQWWPTRKSWYTDEFAALIDRHIASNRPEIFAAYE
jgi:hypothetical protein